MGTNKPNIFYINRSEVEKRLDPYFYKSDFNIIKSKLSKLECSNIKKESIRIFSGITPLSGGNAYTDMSNGVPFIRSGDFSEDNNIEFNNLNYITPEIHNSIMKGSKLKKNDLLIAIVGATIGKVAVYKYDIDANINQAICSIRFKNNINPNFIHIFLLTYLGQKILDRLKRPVARANINLEEVGSIPIPLLDISIQDNIVDFYNYKIKLKQEKEKEAKRLLDSIDDYLLGELGITLPEIDNSLENRVFISSFSEVAGNRLDCKFVKSKNLEDALLSSKFNVLRLNDLIITLKTGTTPHEKYNPYSNDGVFFLRNSNIKNGELDFTDIKFVKNELSNILTYSNVNEVIVCIAGTVGDAAINNEEKPIAINQNISSLKVNEELLNTKFLCGFFNTWICKELVKRVCSVATILYLNNQNLLNLLVPIPPIEKQNEIAEHISKIRDEAKRLQLEAKEILEKAKLEVEQIILGE